MVSFFLAVVDIPLASEPVLCSVKPHAPIELQNIDEATNEDVGLRYQKCKYDWYKVSYEQQLKVQ